MNKVQNYLNNVLKVNNKIIFKKRNCNFYEKIFTIFFCFFISFIVLSFTSNNSFLYCANEWVDVNAFFTVGKSMMNGIIPYKDIFEQKGPLVYFIYGIAYLINNTSYIGVFIIEIITMTITLIFANKCIKLFLDKKWGFIILPIFTMLICTSGSFEYRWWSRRTMSATIYDYIIFLFRLFCE